MSDRYLRDEKQQLLNAIGTELCWGWSPAIDFTEILHGRIPTAAPIVARADDSAATNNTTLPSSTASREHDNSGGGDVDDGLDALIRQLQIQKNSNKQKEQQQCPGGATSAEVHVLLAGASDIRHVFRTLASLRLQSEELKRRNAEAGTAEVMPTYHFYLFEPNLRVQCRHLFFLQWLLESTFSFEQLEERVLMFLDAYGNACTREITAAHSRSVVQRVLKGLQKEEGWGLHPLVSFQEMKLKEKDFVEQQLIHWARDASVADISQQWSQRVRQEMAERYDNRDNIIDWDFVFRITDYTNLLKFPEYRVWRNTGIAFDVCHINPRRGFQYEHTVANKSLCQFDRRGRGVYCGDVKNGPFFALGAQTGNEHIRHRTADGTCKYGNGVVAMHNTRAWLYALMTGQAWPWADHAFAWDDEKHYNYLPPGTPSGVEYQAEFPSTRFHLVGLDFERMLLHIREGKIARFDAAFFGTSCTQMMSGAFLREAMAAHGVVVAETAKFVVDAEEPAKEVYVAKIVELASAGGWERAEIVTRQLHTDQPYPRRHEGEVSAAQQQSCTRHEMPFQIALTRAT